MELRILGPIEARHRGRPVELGAPKERALLALLAARANQLVSVEQLADELWEGTPPDKASAAIQVYVSHLRKMLRLDGEEILLTKSPGYVLSIDEHSVDSGRFEAALAQARQASAAGETTTAAAAAREALACWRGPALSDVLPSHPVAVRLNELRLEALDVRIGSELELAIGDGLIAELEMLTTEHPLHERFWAHRMLALYRAGRQADALSVYQQLRARLSGDLGIDPGPELQRLEQSILRHDPQLDPPGRPDIARSDLPLPLTAFVGRAAELDGALAALEDTRLLSIVGLGGVGKSRVALELVRARARTGDNVFLVQLETMEASGPVLPAIGRVVGAPAAAGLPLLDSIVALIAGHPTVLLLDGCERSLEVAPSASELLNACPELRVVATSRTPLGIAGETVWPLPPMGTDEAVALFVDRAHQADPRASPSDETAVRSIVGTLGGIPLALELAAARVSVLTAEQIAERLMTHSDASDGPHAAVHAALSWSFQRLTPEEQLVLRRLSVLAGSFAIDDAEAICSDRDMIGPQVLPLIARLSSFALLGTEARAGRMRYTLVDSVRNFARDRLREAGEERAALDRHAEHFDRKVRAKKPHELDLDHDNIHAALSWLIDASGDRARALRFTVACIPIWTIRGGSSEGRAWLSRALVDASLPPGDESVVGARLALGAMEMETGDMPRALVTLGGVLRTARELGDRSAIARATLNIGVILQVSGRAEEADVLQRESLQIARELGEDGVAMRALNNLGMRARWRGDFPEARQLYEEAIELARRSTDLATIVSSLMNLANVLRSGGDIRGARQRCEEALAIARAGSFTKGIAACVGTLGTLALTEGDIDAAEAAFTETLDLMRQAGEKLFVASTLGNLSAVHAARGDFDRSGSIARGYLGLAEEIGDARGTAQASMMVGEALVFGGDAKAASEFLERSLTLRVELGERDLLAETLETVALWLGARGDLEEGARTLAAADAIREAVGAPRDGVRTRIIGHALDLLPPATVHTDPDEQITAALALLRVDTS